MVDLSHFGDIKRFDSPQKLKCVLSWVFRFFNDLKQRILKKKLMLVTEVLDKKELIYSEEILILDKQGNLKTDSGLCP